MSMKMLQRFFKRKALIPYNFGESDCPSLEVGDTVITVLVKDAHDFIAGFCGMNMRIKGGAKVKWKVKELLSDGSALLQSGEDRTLLKYLKWFDGNKVKLDATFARSSMEIAFFKVVYQ